MNNDLLIKYEFAKYVLIKYNGHSAEPIIPEEVEIIGEGAFEDCSCLTDIHIPKNVEEIRFRAFAGCKNLRSVEMEKVRIIGENAFEGCNSLFSVQIPEITSKIKAYAFSGCRSLSSIILPDVEEIESCAFFNCTHLISLSFFNHFGYISDSAFIGCKALSNITIGSDVYKVKDFEKGDYITFNPNNFGFWGIMFVEGSSNTSERDLIVVSDIKEEEQEIEIIRMVLQDKQELGFSIFNEYLTQFVGEQTEIIIPQNVTIIGENAFSNNMTINSVIISDGVERIEKNAFSGCVNLASVEIPGSVKVIGQSAFSGCKNLHSVIIPDGVEWIGKNAFSECSALTSMHLSSSLKVIHNATFLGCKELSSIEISDSVEKINTKAFSNCTALKKVMIPDSVKEINDSAFSGCVNLTHLVIDVGVEILANYAFAGCSSLSSVEIPNSVKEMGKSLFSGCKILITVNIPEKIQVIQDDTFYGCDSLHSIHFPDSLKEIGPRAFSGCCSITSIDIPEGAQIIKERAFEDCSALTVVSLPSTLIEINKNAFSGTPYMGSKQGQFLIMNDLLISYLGSERVIQIPEYVKIINRDAFKGYKNLESVSVPGSVQRIGISSFSGCSNLSSVKIANGVELIDEDAFQGCDSLTNVTIQGSLKEISETCFDKLGLREISVTYQHNSPTQSIFGETESDTVDLRDNNNKLICKLYIPRKKPFYSVIEPVDTYVEFIARLIGGMITHLSEYDALFSESKISALERERIILTRLQYSLELFDENKDEYLAYLQNSTHYRMPFLIRENDIASIHTLARHNAIYRQDIDVFIDQALQLNRTEIQAFLMNYKYKVWGKDPFPRIRSSDEFDPNDWIVHENDDCSLTVQRYLGDDVNVTIPTTISGKPVKIINGWNIGDVLFNMFSVNRDKVNSVVIGDGIQKIGTRAFLECCNLDSISIPASINSIGNESFYGCDKLVIHAPKDSYALQYAKEQNIEFVET